MTLFTDICTLPESVKITCGIQKVKLVKEAEGREIFLEASLTRIVFGKRRIVIAGRQLVRGVAQFLPPGIPRDHWRIPAMDVIRAQHWQRLRARKAPELIRQVDARSELPWCRVGAEGPSQAAVRVLRGAEGRTEGFRDPRMRAYGRREF